MTQTVEEILSASTQMGAVTLYVENLNRVQGYYTQGVGLQLLAELKDEVVLGRGDVPVLVLSQKPELARQAQGSAGLYHTAVLFETQSALASAVYSVASKYPQSFTGSSDHLVSEAFYFDDPEGNGVELYWDRPRESWSWSEKSVKMDTLWLDPNKYLAEHLNESATEQVLQSAAKVGHVHLQVGDIPTAKNFYVEKLGFEVTLNYGSQALFVSAGGYHHHLGMNTWNSRGAGLRSPALGLGQVSILVPTLEEVQAVNKRLRSRELDTDFDGAQLLVSDPWGNQVKVSADSSTNFS